MDRKALSAAFPVTVPVLMGYLAIGIAFGLMLQEIGYNFIWAFFMSLTIYAAVSYTHLSDQKRAGRVLRQKAGVPRALRPPHRGLL